MRRWGISSSTKRRSSRASGAGGLSLGTGKPVHITLRYLATRLVQDVEFELRYYSADGTTCLAAPRTGEQGERLELQPAGGTIEFVCDALPLQPGAYYLGAIVRDVSTSKVLAWWDGETRIYVASGPVVTGQLYIPHRWRQVHEAVSAIPPASGAPPA